MRNAQPIEKTLGAVADENALKLLAVLFGIVVQPVGNGSGDVFDLFCHWLCEGVQIRQHCAFDVAYLGEVIQLVHRYLSLSPGVAESFYTHVEADGLVICKTISNRLCR